MIIYLIMRNIISAIRVVFTRDFFVTKYSFINVMLIMLDKYYRNGDNAWYKCRNTNYNDHMFFVIVENFIMIYIISLHNFVCHKSSDDYNKK